jgi:hypothetical protein
MTSRQMVLIWAGVAFGITGIAVALVAWLGLDRANSMLGIPAAVAAVVGLGVAVHGLALAKREGEDDGGGGGGGASQWASASGRSRVLQVGGSSWHGTRPAGDQDGRQQQPSKAPQIARARRSGHVEQVAGDRVVTQDEANETA